MALPKDIRDQQTWVKANWATRSLCVLKYILARISEICESANSDYSVVLALVSVWVFFRIIWGRRSLAFVMGALLIFGQLCWLVPSA